MECRRIPGRRAGLLLAKAKWGPAIYVLTLCRRSGGRRAGGFRRKRRFGSCSRHQPLPQFRNSPAPQQPADDAVNQKRNRPMLTTTKRLHEHVAFKTTRDAVHAIERNPRLKSDVREITDSTDYAALLDCRPDHSLGKSTPRVVVSPLLHACLCPPLARNGSQHSLKHERDGAS